MNSSTDHLALLSEPPSVSRRVVLDEASPTPISRRTVLRTAFALGAAALAATAVGRVGASAQAAPQYKTTAALNLRSGPGTSHAVMTVMPAGSIVDHSGASQNGFFQVVFNGTYGWASAEYLTPAWGQAPPPDGGLGGNGRTTATVNFREGASLSARVIAVLPAGTPLVVHDVGASGFWSVAYNGQPGWIWAEYVERTDGGTPPPSGPTYDPSYATTTANLNLRADASLSAKVLTVMPSGTRVKVLDGYANGFRKVSFNDVTGWAHTSYLN